MSLGLVADIGATNARFALADSSGFHDQETLSCSDFPGIVEAAQTYLSGHSPSKRPNRAILAIAGPVDGESFSMTNHAWSFTVSSVKKALALEDLLLVNDFHAVALAIPHIEPQYLRQIGGGQAVPGGTIGIIGPGTGLGVAALFWNGSEYIANPCEGGHVTAAARNGREFELFQYLRYKYRHVSAERVCSGKGLVNLYTAIKGVDHLTDLPDLEAHEIAKAAMEGTCSVCVEALDIMMGVLGTVSGNLALTLGATGGIYVAGGIPPKLGTHLDNSRFRQEFEAKGRFDSYLKPIPTFVITHPQTAFVGLVAKLRAGKPFV